MSTRTIVYRLGQAIIVLLATFTLAYILLAVLPGDAVGARYDNPELGLSPEQIAEIRASYGADKPAIVQYFVALGGFLTGNFGFSVNSGAAVSTLIAEALPGTLALAAAAFVLALLIAGSLATIVALAPGSWLSNVARSLPPLGVSLPSFLIQFFSFQLGLVPVIGASPVQQLFLPAITLSIPISAPLAQVLIRSIDDVSTMPFVTAVRARGASRAWIFFRNVLRNALLPALTVAGLLFGELVGGAVVTEAVFGRAGIGQMTVQAVANRDTPVLLAVVVISASVYVFINLIVDLLYPVLDPRLRRKANR